MHLRTRIVFSLLFSVAGAAALTLLWPRGPSARAADASASDDLEIRHTPYDESLGWATAETANFRIYHNQTQEVAEKAARLAEAARAAADTKWFGGDAPAWDEPCDIYLYADGREYSLATHQPPQVAGHSSFDLLDGRVLRRCIYLHCDDPNAFVGVLPHETTHIVLAGRFGPRRLPHWVDEGMAVLSEPRDRVALHLRMLPLHRDHDELFPVAELMRMDGYPEPQRIGPFYAESVSLVKFLSGLKGSKAFASFLRDGLDDGYETALKKDYGIGGFDDLQERWQRDAFDGDSGRGP